MFRRVSHVVSMAPSIWSTSWHHPPPPPPLAIDCCGADVATRLNASTVDNYRLPAPASDMMYLHVVRQNGLTHLAKHSTKAVQNHSVPTSHSSHKSGDLRRCQPFASHPPPLSLPAVSASTITNQSRVSLSSLTVEGLSRDLTSASRPQILVRDTDASTKRAATDLATLTAATLPCLPFHPE